MNQINTPFTLPCGVTIKNRSVKAAMTERISNNGFEPTKAHENLYGKWADTGVGFVF